jgi:glycosyltransferase involved in cell wall biosynthesis
MKLSIVTISFNQAEFLERAIQSVLSQADAQAGMDVEYIVVDPGSTDGSREIIERYRKDITHIVFEKDNGPADGLNNGFNLATGDWFGYINSDDYYLPGGLAEAAAAASCYPDAGALVGDGYIVDQNDNKIKRSFSKRVSVNAFRYDCAFALQQATFYRAEVFRALGGFKTSNRTCWDSEILADMVLAGYRVRNLDKNIGAFRVHDASISGSGRLVQEYMADFRRIQEKAFGRTPSSIEQNIIAPAYRVLSYVKTPARTASLMLDKIAQKIKSGS